MSTALNSSRFASCFRHFFSPPPPCWLHLLGDLHPTPAAPFAWYRRERQARVRPAVDANTRLQLSSTCRSWLNKFVKTSQPYGSPPHLHANNASSRHVCAWSGLHRVYIRPPQFNSQENPVLLLFCVFPFMCKLFF